MSLSHLSHPKYRPDIDGLRAVAVLAVVFFHAFPDWIKGGFIGVDVFFVISGYLISTIIYENLDKGTFNFTEFYIRRIRRIFPALILVLVACFIFGWFALLADQYKQLGKHIAAGAGFVSNLVLLSEAGYFDNSAETKPLQHLWSLGIEEQFYIAWPLLIWVFRKYKFNLLKITILIAIGSFILNIQGIKQDSIITFYSPQTRFWELLTGSLLAWLKIYEKNTFVKIKDKVEFFIFCRGGQKSASYVITNVLSWSGLLLLGYGFLRINREFSFPGYWALVPVIGALLIITAGPEAWANRKILSNKFAVWFGLISFPLYLWHWPLLSFARIIKVDNPSRSLRIAAVLLSILFAWLTYKLIEHRVRVGRSLLAKVRVLTLLMIVIGCAGYTTYERNGNFFGNDVVNILKAKPNFVLKERCFLLEGDEFAPECLSALPVAGNNSELKKRILLVGDSHAASLYPELKALMTSYADVKLLAYGRCIPFIDESKLTLTQNYSDYIKGLITNSRCVKLKKDFWKKVDSDNYDLIIVLIHYGNWMSDFKGNRFEPFVDMFSDTLKKHLLIDKTLVLGPLPIWNDDLPHIIIKRYQKFHEFNEYDGFGLFLPIFEVDTEIKEMSASLGFSYESLLTYSCKEQRCRQVLKTDGQFPAAVAYDYGHLTSEGGKYYSKLVREKVFGMLEPE